MFDKVKKKIKKITPTRSIIFILFVLYSIFLLFMMIWTFISSFNEHNAFVVNSLKLPETWHFENYLKAFDMLTANGKSYFQMFINSIWLTFGGTILSTAAQVMVGYALSLKFTGRKTFIKVFIIIMMIPVYGSASATLKMIHNLGMYDSPLIVLKSFSAFGSTTLIVMTYFIGLSPSYGEAAEMDGAGQYTCFFKVYLPMAMPIVSSLFVLGMLGGWNDYSTSIYYLPSYPTVASGLYVYEKVAKFSMDRPMYFAGVIMCAIPPIVIFAVFREKIMSSFTFGGLKG